MLLEELQTCSYQYDLMLPIHSPSTEMLRLIFCQKALACIDRAI
jgi:hypothetical protein